MKNLFAPILCLMLVLGVSSFGQAQAAPGPYASIQIVTTLSQCTWASGVTVSSGVAFCFVNTGTVSTSGLYFALNGGTTFNPIVPQAATAGVTSFNNRTGAITLTDADVIASGVKVATTVTSTTTSTATSTPQ